MAEKNYSQLVQLHQEFAATQGLRILAFPCNQFGNQVTHMHAYTHTDTHAHTCTHTHACIHAHTKTHIHTKTHTYAHTQNTICTAVNL